LFLVPDAFLRLLSDADQSTLVEVAASAQLILERKVESFCRDCGRRLGISHANACSNYEPGDVVHTYDCETASHLIEKRLVALRGGAK
jgi:hypothetical protein